MIPFRAGAMALAVSLCFWTATVYGQATVVNPLPADQLATLYHLPEGGATMPLDFYYSLEVVDSTTGEPTGQGFLERMAGYGFLEDDQSDFPVGFGTVTLDFLNNIQGFSINCSACHVGEIHYQPAGGGIARLRIIGGPNLADVRRFSQDTYYSIRQSLLTPGTLVRLLVNTGRLEPETVAVLAQLPLVEEGRFGYRSDGREADAFLDAIAAMNAPSRRASFEVAQFQVLSPLPRGGEGQGEGDNESRTFLRDGSLVSEQEAD